MKLKIKSLPIVVAAFLILAMAVQFAVSYHREKEDLVRQIEYKMELAQKNFLFAVYDMHEASDEIAHFFPEFDEDLDELYALLEAVLCHYPDLYCCYVTFLPECAPIPGQWSCPTAFRVKGDSIITYDAKGSIPYDQRDWFIGALESEDGCHWSLPYHDGTHDDLVFTHSEKVYNNHDQLVGVAGADQTVLWTMQLLEEIKPYDDAVCQLFSADNTLIAESGDSTAMSGMIVREKTLSPTNMRLRIGVSKYHIREGIGSISLITLSVLLFGIILIGLLLRHISRGNVALMRAEMANRVIEKELQIASTIQLGMLKNTGSKGLEVSGLEVGAKLIPMREVGGDLYDYILKGDDLFFIIGDVSGKGVSAAMFMSATVNLFRSAVLRLPSPKAIMEEINSVLCENNSNMMFVTVFIGRLHVPSGQLIYCNAGHCKPVMVRETEVSGLEMVPNIPLGYDTRFRFEEQGTRLGQGDTLVLYTDGISEARNAQHQMLGFERWSKIIENRESNIDSLLAEVKAFIGSAEQADDITLMTIRKTGEAQPVTLRVENKIDRWPELRTVLYNGCLCAGIDARTIKRLTVALEEAVVNIVNYSKAEWMEVGIKGFVDERISGLEVVLRDNGVPFDPTKQAEVDTAQAMENRQIGGMGIALLRQITDELQYDRTGGINTLTIIKKI